MKSNDIESFTSRDQSPERVNAILLASYFAISIVLSVLLLYRYWGPHAVLSVKAQVEIQQKSIEALQARLSNNERVLNTVAAQLETTKAQLTQTQELSRRRSRDAYAAKKLLKSELPKKADAGSMTHIEDEIKRLELDVSKATESQRTANDELVRLAEQNRNELFQMKNAGYAHIEFNLSQAVPATTICGLIISFTSAQPESQQFSLRLSDEKGETIEKKGWYRNEPIYWYFPRTKDVAEVLITGVTADGISGRVTLAKGKAIDACR